MRNALNITRWPVVVLCGTGWVWLAVRLGGRSLHLLQQDGYLTARYVRWWLQRPSRIVPRNGVLGGLVGLGCLLTAWVLPSGRRGPCLVLWGSLGWWLARTLQFPAVRKPLVLTARARRLVGGQVVSAVALGLLASRFGGSLGVFFSATFAALGAPVLAAAGNLLLLPIEAGFRRYYLSDAANRLRRFDPLVVAVAGSYGKTSTKEFLATILADRFEVLKPPGSYNTPLGLARVIREQLTSRHEVFVAELGDWEPGDIACLCRMLRPSVGLLINVGPEHLERFGTMERIEASKQELFDALPADGTAIVNQDDPVVRRLGASAPVGRVVRFGQRDSEVDVRARDVRTTREGLVFTLEAGSEGPVELGAPLLGRHNVENLLAASAAAWALGMTSNEIARAVRRIRPVEHRLEPIPGSGGVLIVDDAYNANPTGAATALEVLGDLPGGQKILVTPGMIELGSAEHDANRAFGRQAAAVCDEVVLVGRERAVALKEGLSEGNFPPDRIHVVSDLAEATARLGLLVKSGDVVLFENDLPDTYADDL